MAQFFQSFEDPYRRETFLMRFLGMQSQVQLIDKYEETHGYSFRQ